MSPFSESSPGLEGSPRLSEIEGPDFDTQVRDERLQLPDATLALARFDDYAELEVGQGGHLADRIGGDAAREAIRVFLPEEDGGESGGVEDHVGRPRSS